MYCFFIRIPLVVALSVVNAIILISSLMWLNYLGRKMPMQRMLCWQQGQVRMGWLSGSIPSSCCSNGNSKHCIWCSNPLALPRKKP
ncbi:hypothetical protein K6Y31_13145 [Motilimonas cestriensis]|uniref:Uncharacterized protein n=1 Tax=Motilimonas cestriensis TaxID=2742685 RepID=A0ABS8WCA7_9GAMM|nr:hypothetical protein [Motilimonas cestriensis]MCE2595752.1 hypothetical protein [Motilimonas cestriensis]